MSVGKCKGCGQDTNSTTSNWWLTKTMDHATECYARHDGKRWVKGCAYDRIPDPFQKEFVDSLIKDGKNESNKE